jgi:uncharacterized protein
LIVDLDRLQDGGELYEGETSSDLIELNDQAGVVEPKGGIFYKLNVQALGTELLVRGSLLQRFSCHCSFCDKCFEIEVKEGNFVESYEINEEISFLDLTNEIREVIILDLPAYPRCSEYCKGLCPKCGVNLNTSECKCKTENGDDRWAVLNNVLD